MQCWKRSPPPKRKTTTTKACILPFPKKGELGITRNCRAITITSIAAQVYNNFLLSRIRSGTEKILTKNQNSFRRNCFTTSQIPTIGRIIEGVRVNKLRATLQFADFFPNIRFYIQRKDGENTACKETVSAMIKICKQWLAHIMETPTSSI